MAEACQPFRMLLFEFATNGEAWIGIVGQQRWLLGCYDWLPLLVNWQINIKASLLHRAAIQIILLREQVH